MKEQENKGKMLMLRRNELGLSRLDLSKMFGVSERTIVNYVKIMRKHADVAIRTILDKVNEEH